MPIYTWVPESCKRAAALVAGTGCKAISSTFLNLKRCLISESRSTKGPSTKDRSRTLRGMVSECKSMTMAGFTKDHGKMTRGVEMASNCTKWEVFTEVNSKITSQMEKVPITGRMGRSSKESG
jgi:hypothetical protein